MSCALACLDTCIMHWQLGMEDIDFGFMKLDKNLRVVSFEFLLDLFFVRLFALS